MMTNVRIGHGYDAHRFAAPEDDRPLILGGVAVDHDRGLAAHSDGDAVIHALCDALLGAVGEADIGQHFPDTDESYRNADSAGLLRHVGRLLREQGWQPGNADITVVAQLPRLSPFIHAMRERLAELLEMPPGAVNVKATTTEKMGFIGRAEGIAAHAVVLVYRE